RIVLCSHSDFFSIFGRKSTQGVLNLESQLRENLFGDVGGILRNKENADAFGANQLNGGLNLIHQHVGSLIKNKMSFIYKEYKLGFGKIALFRHFGVYFSQQLEHKGRKELGFGSDVGDPENVDDAVAIPVFAQQVTDLKRGLAKK